MNNKIRYITFDEVMTVYQKTIEQSGGGFAGIIDQGKIESIIEFVQNDDYYPDFVSKLNYLVFRFCSGHCFRDGNKRIALTLGLCFLLNNGYYWAAGLFMKRLEAIIYHIAASHIDQELSIRIMECIVACQDFDEELKIDIMHAMERGEIVEYEKGGEK